MVAKFDYGEPIQFAWDKVKNNLGFFIGALLASFVVSMVIFVFMALSTVGSSNDTVSPLFFILCSFCLFTRLYHGGTDGPA